MFDICLFLYFISIQNVIKYLDISFVAFDIYWIFHLSFRINYIQLSFDLSCNYIRNSSKLYCFQNCMLHFIFIFYHFRVSDSKRCARAALNPIASRPKSTLKIPDAVYAPCAAILPQPHKTTHDLVAIRLRSIVKGCVWWFCNYVPLEKSCVTYLHTQTSKIHPKFGYRMLFYF